MKKRMLALAVVTALCLGCLISHVTIGAGAAPLEEDGRLYANFADTAGWVTGNYDKTPTGTAAEGDLRLKSVPTDGKSAGIDPQTLMGTAYYEVTVDLSKYDTVSWSWSENTGASVCAGILEGDSLGAELNGGGRVVGKWGDGISPDKTGSVSLDIAKMWGSSGTKTLKFFVGTWNNGAGSAVGADYRYRIENLCLSSSKAPIPAGPIVEDGKLYANFADKEGWIENYYGGSGEQALTVDGLWDISDVTADGKGATLVRSDDVEGAPGAAYPAFAVYKATVDLSKYDTVYYSFETDFEGSRIGVSNTKSIFADKYANYTGAGSTGELDLAAVFGSTGEKELYFYVGMWNAGKGTGAKINYLYLGKKPAEPEEPLGPITEDGRLYANFKDADFWIENYYGGSGEQALTADGLWDISDVTADGKGATLVRSDEVGGQSAGFPAFAVYRVTADLSKYNTLYYDFVTDFADSRIGVSSTKAVYADKYANYTGTGKSGKLDLTAAFGKSGERELYIYFGAWNAGKGTGAKINSLSLGFEEIPKYTVTVNAQEGGTASGGATVERGDSVTLTATAEENYVFTGWYAGETKVSDEAAYTFAPDTDITLTAHFASTVVKYTLTVNAQEGGTVDNVSGTYEAGTKIKLKAKADDTHRFAGWYKGEQKIADTAEYSYTVSETVTLTAHFTEKPKATPVDPNPDEEIKIWNSCDLYAEFFAFGQVNDVISSDNDFFTEGSGSIRFVQNGQMMIQYVPAENFIDTTGYNTFVFDLWVDDPEFFKNSLDLRVSLSSSKLKSGQADDCALVWWKALQNLKAGWNHIELSMESPDAQNVNFRDQPTFNPKDVRYLRIWADGQYVTDKETERVWRIDRIGFKNKATEPAERDNMWHSGDVYADFFGFGDAGDIAVGSSTAQKTEGTGSLYVTQKGKMMMQVVRKFDATGYNRLVFDLYVPDKDFFKQSADNRVSLSSSKLGTGQADDCSLTWFLSRMELTEGWNHIVLDMDHPDAQTLNFRDQPTYAPAETGYLRIWADGANVTDQDKELTWYLDNLHFEKADMDTSDEDSSKAGEDSSGANSDADADSADNPATGAALPAGAAAAAVLAAAAAVVGRKRRSR